MPPKVKVTKDDIIRAAMQIVRREGADAINARMLAGELGCSTQPVFSNFATMEELRRVVIEQADALFRKYMQQEMESGKYPEYKSYGMAYIRFAKEEKELFKLLYMRNRIGEEEQESDLADRMAGVVSAQTGIENKDANLFHLEMWAYVHGIAVMLATDYLNLNMEFISTMVTDAYQGLKKHYEAKEV